MIFRCKKFVLSMIIRIFAAREPAKPLNDAQMCGSFLFIWVYGNKNSVHKTYSTPQELVQLLKSRGMEITDGEKTQHYLSHIGYYRLSAYMYPLLSIPKEKHLFKRGVSFGKVMMLYRFDKKLRLLLNIILAAGNLGRFYFCNYIHIFKHHLYGIPHHSIFQTLLPVRVNYQIILCILF